VFPQADKIKLIRRLEIFFKLRKIKPKVKIAGQMKRVVLTVRVEKMWRGMNF